MFRVEWPPAALDELANVWTQANSSVRAAITAAAHRADQQMSADPYLDSESRENEERIIFVPPLGFHIEIDLLARTVRVLHVWRFRRRGE